MNQHNFFSFVLWPVQHVFYFILSCMNSSSHCEEYVSVFFVCQFCFGYSQVFFSHEDNGLFVKFCNLLQSGIETTSAGNVCQARNGTAKDNVHLCNEAIDENFTILLMMEDYHNIHTIRRPQNDHSSYSVDHMCTIIIKTVKEAPAIS